MAPARLISFFFARSSAILSWELGSLMSGFKSGAVAEFTAIGSLLEEYEYLAIVLQRCFATLVRKRILETSHRNSVNGRTASRRGLFRIAHFLDSLSKVT